MSMMKDSSLCGQCHEKGVGASLKSRELML